MRVSTRAVIEIERDREAVFAFATNVDNLPRWFRPVGPVAGVERAWVVGGGPTRKGVMRRWVLTDGTPLDEEVLEMEAPRKYVYRLKGYRGWMRALVKHCDGEWIFSPLGRGTRITWTCTAELTSPWVAGVAVPLVKVFMKRAMEDGLGRIKAAM